MLSLDCVVDYNFYGTFLFTVWSPVIFLILVILYYHVRKATAWKRFREAAPLLSDAAAKCHPRWQMQTSKLKSQCFKCFYVVILLIYPSVSRTVFRVSAVSAALRACSASLELL